MLDTIWFQLFIFSLIKYRMYVCTYATSKVKLTSGSYLINLPAMSTILAYNDSAKFGRI